MNAHRGARLQRERERESEREREREHRLAGGSWQAVRGLDQPLRQARLRQADRRTAWDYVLEGTKGVPRNGGRK